jgi:hypothetical protein
MGAASPAGAAAAAAAAAAAGSSSVARAAARTSVGHTCTLGRATLVWREGRFVPAAAGTPVTLGARGPEFTEVSLPEGRARIANTLLGRCD